MSELKKVEKESAVLSAVKDLKSYENILGKDGAGKFLSMIRTYLEKMSIADYNAMKEGIITLASNKLYPMKGRNIAFFLDYSGKTTMQLGYQAFIELASRNGILINAQVVCEGDVFEFNRATGEIYHLDGESRNEYISKVRGVYATCIWQGQRISEYMSRAEVESHRDAYSKVKTGAWKSAFSEMAKKTAIIRLCKKLPMIEMEGLQRAINYENETNFMLKEVEDVKTQEKRKAMETIDLNKEVPKIDGFMGGEDNESN